MSSDTCDEEGACEGCDGSGIRAPASPSCDIDAAVEPWIVVVERCDACERFKDDLAAALAAFRAARWVYCRSGGSHAIADIRSSRATEAA
jgi:hypothetical protein